MAKRGRIPRPWPRKQTGTWYVTLDGKQVPLGKSRREADAEFHRIMVQRGEETPVDSRMTVRELVTLWLDDCDHRLKPDTVRAYRSHAEGFVAACGQVAVKNLKPFHVRTWVTDRGGSQSYQHLGVTIAKLVVQWGEDQGYIAANPIRRLKRPGMERRPPISIEEAQAILNAVRGSSAIALRLMLVTGMRPGEVCSITAERTDLQAGQATVQGKRTKANPSGLRTIYLSPEAVAILRPLADSRPNGLLMGRPGYKAGLTVDTLENAVREARDVACVALGRPPGSLDRITPHCFRGLYSTEALRRGVDSALLSKLLGHSDPTILMKHYASPDDAMLREAAGRATRTLPTPSGTPPAPEG